MKTYLFWCWTRAIPILCVLNCLMTWKKGKAGCYSYTITHRTLPPMYVHSKHQIWWQFAAPARSLDPFSRLETVFWVLIPKKSLMSLRRTESIELWPFCRSRVPYGPSFDLLCEDRTVIFLVIQLSGFHVLSCYYMCFCVVTCATSILLGANNDGLLSPCQRTGEFLLAICQDPLSIIQ